MLSSKCAYCKKDIVYYEGWGLWADKEDQTVTGLICDKSNKVLWGITKVDTCGHEPKETVVSKILQKIDSLAQ